VIIAYRERRTILASDGKECPQRILVPTARLGDERHLAIVTNNRIAHSATKGGVISMARQFAAEGSKYGIRANSISPGMIRTPATEGDLLAADHPMAKIAEHIPLGRIGTPVEVINCAIFLASDEASYVTGTNLMVDGGWSSVLPG
jgi:NAD(P)-dependent dehydrogenase (short-subunit alcohol dehydrogenase family)